MADVVVFHHSLGVTDGVREFADHLESAGHRVTVPDLYDGKTFNTVDEGMGFVRQLGFPAIAERGRQAVASLPNELVYLGFSLGVLSAQGLAQQRPGATGALLIYSCFPVSEFGSWPQGVPVQIHGMDGDSSFVDEGDLAFARELVETVEDAELFLYPGNKHLFADRSLSDYDEAAATLLTQRVLEFLDRVA
jgi:dienelactone hydrolase